jgi:hypothetical protein
MRKSLWIVAVWLFVGPAAAQDVAKPAALDQAALEKKFEQDMTGVYLKGFFT